MNTLGTKDSILWKNTIGKAYHLSMHVCLHKRLNTEDNSNIKSGTKQDWGKCLSSEYAQWRYANLQTSSLQLFQPKAHITPLKFAVLDYLTTSTRLEILFSSWNRKHHRTIQEINVYAFSRKQKSPFIRMCV